jgi:hypothetical protein
LRKARIRGADQRAEGSVTKSFLIAIVFFVIGGSFVALSVSSGIGAGAGTATDLAAAACCALESANDHGLVTDAQFD